jgi:ABC-type glutathione transport system ATPase component
VANVLEPNVLEPNVLEVAGLRTEFKVRSGVVVAVDGVSLSVAQGESVGIVGESGCGKTTTGLAIMRLLPDNARVSAGHVLLGGRDLATLCGQCEATRLP